MLEWPNGAVATLQSATDYEGLDLIPADFSFRNFDLALGDSKKPTKQLIKLLSPINREYDLLFIDSAPSISLVSENIFYAADALLIPLIPSTLSVRTYQQLLRYFKKERSHHLKLLPFFSQNNFCCWPSSAGMWGITF